MTRGCTNGPSGLATGIAPDVLLDLMMPGMGGWEVPPAPTGRFPGGHPRHVVTARAQNMTRCSPHIARVDDYVTSLSALVLLDWAGACQPDAVQTPEWPAERA